MPPADIDVDFWDDVLGNINGAFFLVGEARKNKWGLFMDLAYVDIESENPSPVPAFSSIDVQSISRIVTAAGFYRLVDNEASSVDVLAGMRYWSVETRLKLRAGSLPEQKVSEKEDWVDPVIGIKGVTPIGDSDFFCSGTIAIGGFGAGSDFMWDASINLGYHWGEMFSTTIGFRYLDVDYENDDVRDDISQ